MFADTMPLKSLFQRSIRRLHGAPQRSMVAVSGAPSIFFAAQQPIYLMPFSSTLKHIPGNGKPYQFGPQQGHGNAQQMWHLHGPHLQPTQSVPGQPGHFLIAHGQPEPSSYMPGMSSKSISSAMNTRELLLEKSRWNDGNDELALKADPSLSTVPAKF
mmetsp:Transcript_14805/g.22393  ORF Transcript_14805/g.22393 Transcript_14805/m.22393 type:complete len:158 (-) Transcript_14805:158-631(-)